MPSARAARHTSAALAIVVDENDKPRNDQREIENISDVDEQARTRANFPVIAREGFGHFEGFGKVTRFVAFDCDGQAIVPIVADDKVLFAVREAVIDAVGAFLARGFDGGIGVKLKALGIGEEGFGDGAGVFFRQAGACVGFEDAMREPHDATTGIDADAQFFFLQRFEIADVPIPHRDPVAHEAVGLCKPQGAFEKNLPHARGREDLGTFVFRQVVPQVVQIRFGSAIRLFAVHAKIERSDRKGAVVELDITGETERTCDQKTNNP